jgi:hypothetical protein
VLRLFGLLLGLGELMVLATNCQPGEIAGHADFAENRAGMVTHPVSLETSMDVALQKVGSSTPFGVTALRSRLQNVNPVVVTAMRFAVGALLLGGVLLGLSALPKDDPSWRCAVVGLQHHCR